MSKDLGEIYTNLDNCQYYNDDMFKQYADYYDNILVTAKRREYVERQRYVYNKLKDKGIDETNIERLIEMALHEDNLQHIRRQNIETKVGYLIAYLAVITGSILSEMRGTADIIKIFFAATTHSYTKTIIIVVAIVIITLLAMIFCYIEKSIRSRQYQYFSIDTPEMNAAVDDKEISETVLLENITYCICVNSDINDAKAKNMDKLILWTLIYTIFVLILKITVSFI